MSFQASKPAKPWQNEFYSCLCVKCFVFVPNFFFKFQRSWRDNNLCFIIQANTKLSFLSSFLRIFNFFFGFYTNLIKLLSTIFAARIYFLHETKFHYYNLADLILIFRIKLNCSAEMWTKRIAEEQTTTVNRHDEEV